MECTQRLECTQELYSQSERICPEQIGFLGICGTKYPVRKGPNKIGRDPQTCSICLNLSSVSRQHAVLNIVNKKYFMLMDLDSANKTKLSGKTLEPYIPHPLHNGDTVQFGEIFGIFRLLEEENDLPMTQAIDIPDTPVPFKHRSRVNAVTTIPESPDVSDRDDSFIVPSQPKGQHFQNTKTLNFIKPGKTISIQPVGTNKIDNIYWNSSKKSTSFNLDGSNATLNDSIPAVNIKKNVIVGDIHELETQETFPAQKDNSKSTDSVNIADTQLPGLDNGPSSVYPANTQMSSATSSPSIHSMNTQMPYETKSPSIHSLNTQMPGAFGSPSIHSLETQLPPDDSLPEVCKINEQQDMQFDLCANKANNDSIYDAVTQMLITEQENASGNLININDSPTSIKSNNKHDKSNEDVLFDEVDNQSIEEGLESQAILSEDIDLPINRLIEPDIDSQSQIIRPKCVKRNMRIKSDSSTDCEDIDMLPTQKIPEKKGDEDDITDCEEELVELKTDENKGVSSKPAERFEDMATQVLELDVEPLNTNRDIGFEDMPTQVLDIEKDALTIKDNSNTDLDFEDLPTQVLLDEDVPVKNPSEPQQFPNKEDISPFKVPFNSPLKAKKKDFSKTPKIKPIPFIGKYITSTVDDARYYQDTQDIYEDLCSQKEDSPQIKSTNKSLDSLNKLVLDTSVNGVDDEDKVNDFVSNLSSQEVRDVIGTDTQVTLLKKVPSDESTASDVEVTPKKRRPFKFMDIDLPNSQEIKTTVCLTTKSMFTESSSESDTENNSEDQCTPILFRKKKKVKPDAKLDLTKKFDVEALPSRVITRVRKPTAKIQDQESKKASENILKPKFLAEQEGEIDKEIITENISRLKSKNEKSKNVTSNDSNKQADGVIENIVDSVKKERSCRKKTEDEKEKVETKPEKANHASKIEKIKRREPRNSKKEPLDSKNQSSITSKSTNLSLDSIVEPKNKTHSSNKSKELKTVDLTGSPVEIKRSTRSARNAKTKDKTQTEQKTASPERNTQTEKQTKRKYTTRKQAPKVENKREQKELSPEKEVRRSKRQRTAKEQKEEVKVPKSILKKSIPDPHEESAVYNLSSGSNSDSSRSFKRPALNDSEVPSPKRTRSMVINNTSLRATPARIAKTQYVLFTAFPYEAVKVKLENMGAVVVTDLMKSTVLLTRQIKRTFKLLCAVGLGKPIVGPSWVQACADTNMIVDPWLYLIKDETAEKRFHFSLERTLTGKRNFLKGYNVSSTPKVMPEAYEMKLIVECSGGTWREGGPNWICVSVTDDIALWPALRARGAILVSTEFILGGVLRQKVEIERNKYK